MKLAEDRVIRDRIMPNKVVPVAKDAISEAKPVPVNGQAPLARLYPLRELHASMQPPRWLWKPVLQRGLFYAMCAHPGAGKTAVALLVAFLVDLGRSLDFMRIKKGRVVYFVGEGLGDMRFRAEAMYSFLNVRPENVSIDIVPLPFFFASNIDIEALKAQVKGEYDLMIVDTAAAFYTGEEENDNKQQQDFAAQIRSVMRLLGDPACVMLTHPPKAAERSNITTRGGSAFLGTLDGELCLWIEGPRVELFQNKRRGPSFEPMFFEICDFEVPELRDNFDESSTTVYAKPLSEADAEKSIQQRTQNEDRVLYAMLHYPNESLAGWAIACGWGEDKKKVQRTLVRLNKIKPPLTFPHRGGKWALTKAGTAEAERIK